MKYVIITYFMYFFDFWLRFPTSIIEVGKRSQIDVKQSDTPKADRSISTNLSQPSNGNIFAGTENFYCAVISNFQNFSGLAYIRIIGDRIS